MKLLVTDETYQTFATEYPSVEKAELERVLINSKPFSEYDYYNHFEISELPKSIYDENFLLADVSREWHSFFIRYDDQITYDLPSIIKLKQNSDRVVYYLH